MLAGLGREIIRKVRGAIGMGVFGAVGFVAFGALVTVLSRLLFGYSADLFGNLLPLAGTGFVSGVLAAVGIAVGAKKEGGISTGRAFVAGLPLGVVVHFFIVGRLPLDPQDPEFVGFYVIAFLLRLRRRLGSQEWRMSPSSAVLQSSCPLQTPFRPFRPKLPAILVTPSRLDEPLPHDWVN